MDKIDRVIRTNLILTLMLVFSSFLILGFMTFILYKYLFYVIPFQGIGIFSWVVLSLVILIFFILLLWICVDFIKFVTNKNVLTKRQLDKFAKRKNKFKIKDYWIGVKTFVGFFDFFVFSVYMGMLLNNPIWFFKFMKVIISASLDYRKKGYRNLYGWRKVLLEKEKDYHFYPFVFPLNKKKR